MLLLRPDAIADIDARARGIRADCRNLIDDATERVVALVRVAGEHDVRRGDAGRRELCAIDVPAGFGDDPLWDRYRIVIEDRIAHAAAAQDRIREWVEVDTRDAGDGALHRPLRVTR
jgi:hypothetical protein